MAPVEAVPLKYGVWEAALEMRAASMRTLPAYFDANWLESDD
jgi:hypothetical protein